MKNELEGATWELEPEKLARALSAKTRKENAPALTIAANIEDKLEYYDVKIDNLNSVLDSALKLFTPDPLVILSSEGQNYKPFSQFMNQCLDVCHTALGARGG
jgi:tRNA A37 threonylcarbamoyladenosine synthetase subunit TsaC/SUA5/YrdC